MRIHAILDRSVFKQGESGVVTVAIYDSDGKLLQLQNDDIITITAKRWTNSEDYLLEDTNCDISDASYGECEFFFDFDTSTGNGRYLAEITLKRIVNMIEYIYKSSDFTIWIESSL